MCDGSEYEEKHDKCKGDRDDFRVTSSFITKRSYLRFVKGHPREEYIPSWPKPHQCVYPKANVYYASSEDTNPFDRIDSACQSRQSGTIKPHFEPPQEPYVTRDPYSEARARQKFLETKPTCFAIFGKPDLNITELATMVADAWNCVLISPASLIREEIKLGTEKGRVMVEMLKLGQSLGQEVIMNLIESRLNMRDVQHRGYIVEGLPLIPNNINLDYSEYPSDTTDWTKHQGVLQNYSKIFGTLNDVCCAAELNTTLKDTEKDDSSNQKISIFNERIPQNETCRVNANHEYNIANQINDIFTAWPMKPMIIIYAVCPRNDAIKKREYFRMNSTTGETIDTTLFEVTTNIETGYTHDKPEGDINTSAEMYQEFMKEKRILEEDPDVYLLQRIADRKYNVEAQYDFYERLAMPVIDKWISLHNPQNVIRVDNRASILKMFQIISARLRILPIPRLILPRPMDETEMELGGESPVMTTPVNEFEGKTNEEIFQDDLMNRNTVSHMFPWRLSSWRFICPVELIKGRTVEGTWKHAVRFMDNIYFLSSSEAADLFISNPRTFLLPFIPRPTCRIAVFGPRYSGKSNLCKRLARFFRGTLIDVREIEKSLTEYRIDLDIEVPMTIEEKANIIIENINNIAEEEIDVGIWRDGGYVVDGMYADVDVWKTVVEKSKIVFEDVVYLFDEAPYEYLINKWRDANRIEEDFYESTEEQLEWLGDRKDEEEEEEEEMEALADYLTQIQQFELDWEVLKESVVEVAKSLTDCNLREVDNASIYVTENIKHRYCDKARIMSDEEKEKERELIEYPVSAEDAENIDPITQDNRRLGDTNYYCPVALSENNILWPGKEEFSALFLNKIYHLSSAKALEEFELNPRKYSVPFLKPPGTIPPLRISVLGPTGSGKSTLSAAISREYGLMHIDYFQEFTKFMKNRAMLPISPKDSFVSPENLLDDVELPEELEDERYNSHAATVQTFIRGYWRNGGVLTRQMMRECLSKFFQSPHKEYGLILDGFPSCTQDVETATANYTVPEVMIELRCDKDAAFNRAVPELLVFWKHRQDERKEAEKLRYEDAVRDWTEKYEGRKKWINKMLRERRKQMEYDEITKEDNEVREDVIEDAPSFSSVLQDYSDDEEEYNFERAELEEIWKQEHPLPVLFTDWEDFETAKERIERGFEEMYENDSRKLDEIRSAMENESIPWHQINAEKEKRALLLEIMRILDPYVFRNFSAFERTYAVDPETAENLLDCGYYLQSSFGRLCPVQLYRDKLPVHMFLPLEARGEIYPVIHRRYIYFLGGKEAHAEFSKNPLKYLEQDSCSPLVPFRISIIGPPKCGKTTLAERFSREYGMKIITRGKALRSVTKHFPWTETSRLVESDARRGRIALVKSIARTVEMYSIDPSAASQGILLDGFPENRLEYEELVFLGLQPMIILDLKANFEFCLECLSRGNNVTRMPPNFSAKFLARRYANWEVDQENFRDWSKKFSQNVTEVDGTGSTWFVWTRANEAVCATFRKIKQYFRESDYDKVHRLEHMCVSPYEFRKRQSQCESYCPLCLIEESSMKTSGPPPNHQGMVQFREHFYWFCSGHINRFINDPLKHVSLISSVVLPERRPRVLQEIVDKEHSCWATRLRVGGFCLVTYVENLPSRKLVPGKSDLGVMHEDSVYLFCSVECRQQFLERYDKYTSVDIKFPRVLPPIDIKNLPTLGFLEQTVAKLIIEAVNEVSVLRPKLPGLSSSATAAIYIAVYLKIRNVSCNLRETNVYESVKERIGALIEIINVVTRTIKRKLNPYVTVPERTSEAIGRISELSQLSGRNFIKFRRTSPTQTLTDPEDMPGYPEFIF